MLRCAVLAFAVLAGGVHQAAFAEDEPTTRIVQDHVMKLTTVAGREVIVEELDVDAGLNVPTHRHTGPETLSVLTGVLIVQFEGEEPRVLEAGQSILIRPGVYHRATIGPEGANIIVMRVHPSGDEIHIAPDRDVDFPE